MMIKEEIVWCDLVEELEIAIQKDNNTIGKWEVVGKQTKHNLKF